MRNISYNVTKLSGGGGHQIEVETFFLHSIVIFTDLYYSNRRSFPNKINSEYTHLHLESKGQIALQQTQSTYLTDLQVQIWPKLNHTKQTVETFIERFILRKNNKKLSELYNKQNQQKLWLKSAKQSYHTRSTNRNLAALVIPLSSEKSKIGAIRKHLLYQALKIATSNVTHLYSALHP